MTTLTPHQLLKVCKRIEASQQRVHKKHWGPRVIDLDVLLYSDATINTKDLKIPHPEMLNRDFVTCPLLEINSKIKLPSGKLIKDGTKTTIRHLLSYDY